MFEWIPSRVQCFLLSSFLCWCVASVSVAQDTMSRQEIEAATEDLAARTVAATPGLLLPDADESDRLEVAIGLLERGVHIRDAVLTIAASGPQRRPILESLGPKTRELVVPVALEWVTSGNDEKWQIGRNLMAGLESVPASAVPKLIEMASLTENKDQIIQLACEWLGRVQPSTRAVEALERVVEHRRDLPFFNVPTRSLADLRSQHRWLQTIVRFKLEKGQLDIARDILPVLKNGSERERELAAEALEAANGADAVAAVERELRRGRPTSNQITFLSWLADTKHPAASAADVVLPLASSDDAGVANTAVHALRQIGGFTVEDLKPIMKNRSDWIRLLGSCSADSRPKAIRELKNVLAGADKSERSTAACELARLKVADQAVLDTLAQDIASDSWFVSSSARALTALGKDAEPVLHRLLAALKSPKRLPPRLAANAIVVIGKPAVPGLIELLTHREARTRGLSARALGQIGDVRALKPLIKLLDDGEAKRGISKGQWGYWQYIKSDALIAIGDLGPLAEPAVDRLITELKDPEYAYGAAQALGDIGPLARRAIPALQRAGREAERRERVLRKAHREDDENQLVGDDGDGELVKIVEFGTAIARIHPEGGIGLMGMRRMLIPGTGNTWSAESAGDAFALLESAAEDLAKMGAAAKPLIPDLAYLVESHELLHPMHRFCAAYALTKLDSSNPKWHVYVERSPYRKSLRTAFKADPWPSIK